MQLDVTTLVVAGAFVALLSGFLLGFASYHYGEIGPGAWWATANAALAAGLICLATGSVAGVAAIFTTGLMLMCVSAALCWGGARLLDRRPVSAAMLIAGPALWAGVQFVPSLGQSDVLTATVSASVTLAYYGSAALGLWRRRGDGIRARVPLSVLLAIHAATLCLAVPASQMRLLKPNQPASLDSLFGIIHFETLLFVVGTTIFVFAIMKERNEARLIEASNTDSLTGLSNRRGFFAEAGTALDRCLAQGHPASMIIFDIDHFKLINDNHGHAAGDEVLRAFAYTCRRFLRDKAVVGRIGGEEFAALLPGSGIEAACARAERLRRGFAEMDLCGSDRAISVTVSAGVSCRMLPEDVYDLLSEADAGLYEAKTSGRNRVVCGGQRSGAEDRGNVIRVA